MPTPDLRARFRFRDVVLDVPAFELRRDGRAVRLERQPMDLLILLVERRGQLVSRAEIVEALWGKDVFVDVETGVHTAVRKIRQALRDSADTPAFIETVPGRGYRFIAPVEALPAVSPEPPATASTLPATTAPTSVVDVGSAAAPLPAPHPDETTRRPAVRRRPTRDWLVLGVLGVAAITAVLLWSWLRRPAASAHVVIAVLPFENLSGDPESTYLADGLAEDTIVSLGRVDPDRVSVIGRTSMQSYKGTTKSLAEIGRELGVDYLVESSLRAERGNFRITSRLVRAGDQVQVWSHSFDKTGGSLLAVEQELSRDIAEQVRSRISPERERVLQRRHTRDPEAYDHFLRGRDFFNQRSPEAMRLAIDAFQSATAHDPDYALAWAGLAAAHNGRVINSDADPGVVRPLAREAAQRAVRLDPDLAEAQHALGMVNWMLEWNWPVAETALRRAAALDPNSSLTLQTLGHLLSQAGRHADAEPTLRRARELDPLNAVPWALSSQVAFQARDHAAALEFARRAIVLNPGLWFGHHMLAQAQEQLGHPDAALDALSSANRFSGQNSKPVSLRGYILARTGHAAEARAVLAALEATSRERYVPPYAMALVHAGLGDDAAAFEWLERAFAARDVHLIYLPVDAKWDRYRADPRFVALLARCHFTL